MVEGVNYTHLKYLSLSYLYYLPTLILPSILNSNPSLRHISMPGNGPKASRLLLIEWETRSNTMFVGISNSDHLLSTFEREIMDKKNHH
jgi:hypothetical protein